MPEKKRILIIEDEIIIQRNLLRSLQREGFEVTGASTGREACRVLDSLPIDMVLLDIGLPDVSGFVFLKDARTLYPHLQIIVLTAQEPRELEERAYQLGARAFFRKPFSLAHLKATIRTVLAC